jgi:hypothetical protein
MIALEQPFTGQEALILGQDRRFDVRIRRKMGSGSQANVLFLGETAFPRERLPLVAACSARD